MNLNFDNVDVVCSQVDLSGNNPTIDLSTVNFIEPFALIYLGMFLRHFNANGRSITVSLPTDSRPREYLVRQNFFGRFNFNPATIDPSLLRRFTGATSLNDVVDIEGDFGIDE